MRDPLIAVLSGKGGTGKTMVSVALALSVPRAQLLDCDVEEPDAGLYLRLAIRHRETVTTRVPALNEERCDGCADRPRPVCSEVCEYGAVAVVRGRVVLHPARCNGCAACIELCPRGALGEGTKPIGLVEEGEAGDLLFTRGTLCVGEPRTAELVRAVRRRARPDRVVVIDGPPGAGSAAAEAVRGTDAVVLVAEPTPFGRRDLERVLDLCRRFGVPAVVVLNRSDLGDREVDEFCRREGVPVVLRIPFSRRLAESLAHGVPLPTVRPELAPVFRSVVLGFRSRSEAAS